MCVGRSREDGCLLAEDKYPGVGGIVQSVKGDGWAGWTGLRTDVTRYEWQRDEGEGIYQKGSVGRETGEASTFQCENVQSQSGLLMHIRKSRGEKNASVYWLEIRYLGGERRGLKDASGGP